MNLPLPKKSYGILPILLTISFSYDTLAQSTPESQTGNSSFQVTPLVIDGKENDWKPELLHMDEQAGISYSVTNNDSAIFICLKSQDDIAQARMLRAGFTVYIDASGKKKQNAFLQFPLPVEDDRFPAGSPDLKAMETIGLLNARQYKLSGFDKGSGSFNIDQVNDNGIEVKISFNEKGLLVYEAVIPFYSFYNKEKINADDSGKPIAVGFFINAISRPASSSTEFSSRRTSVNLEDQFNTSRGPAPGSRKMQQLYSKSKSWTTISIAIAGN